MELGTLAAIWRYPVKSLAGESLAEIAIGDAGLEGDRERALTITTPENPRAGKPLRGKEHDRLHLVSGAAAGVEIAEKRGISVEVTHSEERYFDTGTVSLIIDRWLDGLSDHVGYRVEYQRFRPNLFVTSDGESPSEDELTGRELHLGAVRFRVSKPIERCVVTTYHLGGEASDPRILRYVAQERSTWMGIYCEVIAVGHVHVGDRLLVVD